MDCFWRCQPQGGPCHAVGLEVMTLASSLASASELQPGQCQRRAATSCTLTWTRSLPDQMTVRVMVMMTVTGQQVRVQGRHMMRQGSGRGTCCNGCVSKRR